MMQTIDRQTKSGSAAACCARLKSVAKPAVTAGFMLAIVGCHSAVRTSITEISGNGQRLYLEARELYAKSRAADEQGMAHDESMRKVVRLLEGAIHNDPNCPLFHSRLAEVLLELEGGESNYSIAEKELRLALDLSEDWVPAWIALANRSTRLAGRFEGHYQDAEDYLQNAEKALERIRNRLRDARSNGLQTGLPGLSLSGQDEEGDDPSLGEKRSLSLLLGWMAHNESWQEENPLGSFPSAAGSSTGTDMCEILYRRLRARTEYQRAEIMVVAGLPAGPVIDQLQQRVLAWDPNLNSARLELGMQMLRAGRSQDQESILFPYTQPNAPQYIRGNGRITYEVAAMYVRRYQQHRSNEAFNAASEHLVRLINEINPAHAPGLLAYAELLYQAGTINHRADFLKDALECLNRAGQIDPAMTGLSSLRANVVNALSGKDKES